MATIELGKASRSRFFRLMIVLLCVFAGFHVNLQADEQIKTTCSYNTWSWDTLHKKSVNHSRIVKNYEAITDVEKDATSGCTVCEEDQDWISIQGVPKFRVCKQYKEKLETVINTIVQSGFPILEIQGYRVGKSKGPIDQHGLRTLFSNHSFGTAVDINRNSNGLYANCMTFSPKCKLVLGGLWNPEKSGTLTPDSVAVHQFKSIGWKWGGEIAGRQKDFMHFSISGY